MDSLTVGLKGHGKTTLNLKLVEAFKKIGEKSVVLTPMRNDVPRWKAAGAVWVTMDQAEFLRVVELPENWRLHLFVDEIEETIGQYDARVRKFVTQARNNNGHQLHFIGQRAKQVHPTVRNNCTRIFALRQTPADCEVLADMVGEARLAEAAELMPMEFVTATTVKGSYRKGKL